MLQHVAECKLHVKRHVTARYVLQVGEEYQIEVEPGPSTITSEACRTRLDMLTWCPNRAAAEGIDVPCYLAGAARLNAVTREPLEFSPEAALRCATCRHRPLLTIAYRCLPLPTVANRCLPQSSHTVTTA